MASPSTKYVKIPSKHLPEPFQIPLRGDIMTKNIRFRAFLLISAKKAKKRETVFIQINGKTGSWILYMYYLVRSGTC